MGDGTIVIRLAAMNIEEVKSTERQLDAAKVPRCQAAVKASGAAQAAKRFHVQPTAAEVANLTLGKLGHRRVDDSELSNHFARLLNRGSSLE